MTIQMLHQAAINRQIQTTSEARGFVVCTSSPITPSTPLSRVRKFIELAHLYGSQR